MHACWPGDIPKVAGNYRDIALSLTARVRVIQLLPHVRLALIWGSEKQVQNDEVVYHHHICLWSYSDAPSWCLWSSWALSQWASPDFICVRRFIVSSLDTIKGTFPTKYSLPEDRSKYHPSCPEIPNLSLLVHSQCMDRGTAILHSPSDESFMEL